MSIKDFLGEKMEKILSETKDLNICMLWKRKAKILKLWLPPFLVLKKILMRIFNLGKNRFQDF